MGPTAVAPPSVWRDPMIAACIVAAAAHVPVTPGHLARAPYIGVLFILLEVGCLGVAVLLLAGEARWLSVGAALLGAGAVVALIVSRTVGLPLMAADIGAWSDPLATISLAAESVMVAVGVGGALAPRFGAGARRSRLVSTGASALGAIAGLTLTLLMAAPAVAMG